MSRLVRLYPPAWRERYEAEFVELLAARRPGILDRIDIVRGALDAQLHPQVRYPQEDGQPTPEADDDVRWARRLGLGAVGGTAPWIAAWALYLVAPIQYDDEGAYRDGAAAWPFLLGAAALFTGGLVGQLMRLPPAARLARAGAMVAIPGILLWGMAPWLIWAGGLMIGGLLALGLGGRLSGMWPTWSSVAVVGACVVVVALMGYGVSTAVDRMAGGVLLSVAGALFVPAWLGVGGSLVARPA